MKPRRVLFAALPLALLGLAVGPGRAIADAPPCAWEIEYTLAANLKLTETPMGEGDGIYPIGPGSAVLRWDDKNGAPGGDVKLLRYSMKESFTVTSKTLFWTTTVITDTRTTTAPAPNACGVVAEGALDAKRAVQWRTWVSGYRFDGTLTCRGSLCGKFGAPPAGTSDLHVGPYPVRFNPFVFAPDMQTFTMQTTHVTRTEMPKQAGEVALAGREVRRACVPIAPCPK